ncbi:MAG: EamA family transporter [Solirubrobacteraceae bacterium]
MLRTRATEDAAGGSFAAGIPPTALVLFGIGSVQFGSALARTLFDDIGPGGTVMMRIAFASVILGLLWRPSVGGHSRRDLWLAAAFGLALAAMNFTFYESLDRIPLGAAVTCEFVGPLGVAVFGSRRARDLAWVLLAAGGILLLAAPSGSGLNAPGVILALVAGGCWAAYILLTVRVGRAFPGGNGLALAMGVAAVLILPVGIAQGGSGLLRPEILAAGLAVAVLSSLIPYSLELEALRRLPPHLFGVLMSLEPAAAAVAGLVVLGQVLKANQWAGMALVIVASAGATRFADRRTPAPRDA